MKTWYELFESLIDGTNGTRTLEICNTLKEAKKQRERYAKTGLWTKEELYIDKWENIDNPKKIGDIL